MKQLLAKSNRSPTDTLVPRQLVLPLVLSASALACSVETTPLPSPSQSGAGGQATAGSGSGGMAGGAGGAPVGGASGGGGGAAGMTGGGAGGAGGNAGGAGSGGVAGSGGAAGSGGVAGSGGAAGEGWIPLFNGTDLDGWTVYGTNEKLFTVANGEIHVYPTQADQSNQPQANMVHETEIGGKYTLHVEYKWGDARFGDRKQTERDAGILFHIKGDVSKVWPDSIECQLGSSPVRGEWVTGDLWVLGTPMTAQTKGEDGQLDTYGSFQRSYATAQEELPKGEWNVVQVIVNGADEAVYMVNGKEVNRVLNMKHNGQPLTSGFISIQAEFAELFYRNIRYKKNE
jgi:hypothetical protein